MSNTLATFVAARQKRLQTAESPLAAKLGEYDLEDPHELHRRDMLCRPPWVYLESAEPLDNGFTRKENGQKWGFPDKLIIIDGMDLAYHFGKYKASVFDFRGLCLACQCLYSAGADFHIVFFHNELEWWNNRSATSWVLEPLFRAKCSWSPRVTVLKPSESMRNTRTPLNRTLGAATELVALVKAKKGMLLCNNAPMIAMLKEDVELFQLAAEGRLMYFFFSPCDFALQTVKNPRRFEEATENSENKTQGPK